MRQSAATEHALERGLSRLQLASLAVPLAAAFCVAWPYLTPRTGPLTISGPLLVAALCTAALAILAPPRWSWRAAAVALVLSGWVALRSADAMDALGFAGAALLMLLTAGVARGHARLWPFVAGAWIAAALVNAVVGLLQYFHAAGPLGLWVSSAGDAFGILRQRNQLALLLAIGLAAVLWHPMLDRRWKWAMAALLAVACMATTSRIGLILFVLIPSLAVLWTRSRRDMLIASGVTLGAYVLATLALPRMLERIAGGEPPALWERVAGIGACNNRGVLWSNMLDLVAQKPWGGWGWGEVAYAHYVTLFSGPRFCVDVLHNAHNLPLQLAVTLGIPFALIVMVLVVLLPLALRPWRETDPFKQMAWTVILAIALHSQVEYPLWYGPFQMTLGLAIGMVWPTSAAATPAPQGVARRIVPMLLLAAAFLAWRDHDRVAQAFLPVELRREQFRDNTLLEVSRTQWFKTYALYVEYMNKPLTRRDAEWIFNTGTVLLHFSAGPRVIVKLVDSALLLGRIEDARFHLVRLRAAYPEAYAKWRAIPGHEAIAP